MERQYKDSGIEWIGKIPEDWKVERIKDNIIFNPENTNSDEGLEVSYMPMDCLRFNHIEEKTSLYHDVKSYTPFEEGDIVMAKVTPCYENGNIAIAKKLKNGRGYGTSEIFVIRASERLNTEYLFYYLYTPYVVNRAVSSMVGTGGLKRINPTYFLNTSLLIPPSYEQQRIADYLDKKCGEIDSLIELQEQMIEKLKAYKQSVITEAVTKGLDPNAKLVPSGIDWIGDIPEGWKIGRIKNVAGLFGRIGFRGYNSDDLNKDGVGAITLSPSNMQPMDMDYSSVTYLSWEKYYESPEIMIQNGDLLYVKTGSSYGKVSYVHDLPREATINPQILRIVPKIDNKYLGYFMQSTLCEYQTKVGVVGGTIPTISQEKINNFWVLLPLEKEQHSIASYLDEKCSDIDRLIALKQQKIESLKDYKKSVIYEAVTGKTIIE